MGDFGNAGQYCPGKRLRSSHHRNLLGHNDDADGGQHAVYDRGREKGGKPTRFINT